MLTYNKPYLPPRKQLDLLKSRGLQVNHESDAIAALIRNGYYRLSAYWFPFRKIVNRVHTDDFLDHSFFEDALALYRFDKELKIVMMDVIERVEIAVRVQIALLLSPRDKLAHKNSVYFNHHFTASINPKTRCTEHQTWLARFEAMLKGSSEDFIKHHRTKYGSTASLPLWIAIEVWDFGMTSRLFSGMKGNDQNQIARNLKVVNGDILSSWLRSINYIRNIIAHHGRLWNRSMVDAPKMPTQGDMVAFDVLRQDFDSNKKLYYACCILSHLSESIKPDSNWQKHFVTHINKFPKIPHAHIGNMGFPPGWETHQFWR